VQFKRMPLFCLEHWVGSTPPFVYATHCASTEVKKRRAWCAVFIYQWDVKTWFQI